MKPFNLFFSAVLFCAIGTVNAQNFSTVEYIDVNKIKGATSVHGDIFFDPVANTNICEFPKGTGKHASGATSLWMSGFDSNNNLHMSSQTYSFTGTDYWPGPLKNDTLTLADAAKWNKIWKVSFWEINAHLANSAHTISNTPGSILTWPAKGNPNASGVNSSPLIITSDMAPFVDVNNDGKYNALDGDYPDIKGDQMLWWIFSDNGPIHNISTDGVPLKTEVHATAYAYSRNSDIDNIIFYDYKIHNKSSVNYQNYRLALWCDIDLGYYRDDYVGFDSSRRLGYCYNGRSIDGTGQEAEAYGIAPPISGYTLLNIPGDNGTTKVPVGSFIRYNNDNSVQGNPVQAIEYYNYMNAMWRDGSSLINDYAGKGIPSNGMGTGNATNYIFPGNPADTNEWSECASNNPVGDRRFVMSGSSLTFNAGSTINLAFAFIVTDTASSNTCPNIDITNIKNLADTAWKYYNNPPTSYVFPLSLTNVENKVDWNIYPNPANNVLHIEFPESKKVVDYDLSIEDITGRQMSAHYQITSNRVSVDISQLSTGIYTITYSNDKEKHSKLFIKE